MKKLAASEKCVAAPPRMRSRLPNGVSSASNATDPTTVTRQSRRASGLRRCQDLETGGCAERLRLVGALPREVGVVAAEMAVRGRLA